MFDSMEDGQGGFAFLSRRFSERATCHMAHGHGTWELASESENENATQKHSKQTQ
jgi:hypothetical protein